MNYKREFKEMRNAVSLPVIGLLHDVQRLANKSPKQSAQYGFSSRLVKRCPANGVSQ